MKRRFSTLLSLAAALCESALAQTWIEMGPGVIQGGQVEGIFAQNQPVYGAVQKVAVHPTDPDVVLVGSVNGGVWRTTNATALNPSWAPLTDFLPSLSIGSLTFDRADANTIYAGNGNYSSAGVGGDRAGLFVSHDVGAHWAPVPGNAQVYRPGIDISDIVAKGSTILLSSDAAVTGIADTGIYRSIDGGSTFEHLSGSAPGLPIGVVSSLVGDPTNASRFYAAAYFSSATNGVGIYRTEDTGTTWSRVSNSAIDALLDTSNNIQLAINEHGTLFAGVVDHSQLAGFFRTEDHGATFTDFGLPTTTEGNPPVVVGIHPYEGGDLKLSILADRTNDDVVFVGGDAQPYPPRIYNGTLPNSIGANFVTGRLFRSTAPGVWIPLTHSGTADNSAPHGDSRDMAFDLNGNILEVNDGGVYRRSAPMTNNGIWTAAGGAGATAIRVTEIHSVAYDNHGSVIMAGTQDNGTITQAFAGDITWPQIGIGDGGKVAVFDASRTGNSFDYYGGTYLSGFQRAEFTPAGSPVGNAVASALQVDGSGKTLNQVPGSRFDANILFYTPFTVNEVAPGRLVFGSRSLYESADHGDHLTALGGIAQAGGGASFNDGIDNDNDGTVDEADERRPQVVFNGVVRGLAYGGFKNGVAFADVLYSGAGTELRIRPAGGGFGVLPVLNSAYNAAAGNSGFEITALTLAQSDWETAFVGDNLSRVFRTFDGGLSWVEIPGLYPMDGGLLTALVEVEAGSVRALFAGAGFGVFWTVDRGTGFSSWSEFGAESLPNAVVGDLDYDPTDDVLVVGTIGRGAWEVPAISTYLTIPEPAAATLSSIAGLGLLAGSGRVTRVSRKQCQ